MTKNWSINSLIKVQFAVCLTSMEFFLFTMEAHAVEYENYMECIDD